jgi:hypothetical protein
MEIAVPDGCMESDLAMETAGDRNAQAVGRAA